jgi:hypothetical protein
MLCCAAEESTIYNLASALIMTTGGFFETYLIKQRVNNPVDEE